MPDTNSKLPGTEADLNKCTEDGSVDYKGQPAKRTKTGTWKAVPYLFGKQGSLCTCMQQLPTPSLLWLGVDQKLPTC